MVRRSVAMVLVVLPKRTKLKLNRLKALNAKSNVKRGKFMGGGFIYYK